MNDIRIKQYVDDIFKGVKMTDSALDQKEELIVNITERVRDYMRDGLSFEMAFETAKNSLGDMDELTAPFDRVETDDEILRRQNAPFETMYRETPKSTTPVREHARSHMSFEKWALAALSPFIYIMLGFMFGWWAWAWVVIPGLSIISTPIPLWTKFVSLSPFIYVVLGFLFGWWAWAWVIIPISGILSQAVKRRA